MKKIFTALVVSTLLAPAFASADSFGIEPTRGQLLSRIAALESIVAGKSINCAVATTKSTVRVGEQFTIAWGSFGADSKYSNDPQNAYAENGEQVMQMDFPQIRTYKFTFFGPHATKATCQQTITVLAS